MFKKPLKNWKTSSPLRTSDRKKLKQKISSLFGITEGADKLVPEGLLSIKFSTHIDEPGVAYLAPSGDPLWFTIGKGSEDLIPTVYSLWQYPKLLPFVSTPQAVISILSGGADLMRGGVLHCSPSLDQGYLVSICSYDSASSPGMLSPPLAVGRMAISSDQLRSDSQEKEKGKAVFVLHTWKDHLWELGSKGEVPASIPLRSEAEEATTRDKGGDLEESAAAESSDTADPTTTATTLTYTPEEISQLLRMSLLQSITSSLSSLPPSSFPIPATTFYTTYILPNRPNFPELVLLPASAPPDYSPSGESPGPDPYVVTIKSSSHKSLSAFLKAAEKSSLISTKAPPKHSAHTDVLVTSVNASHPEVQARSSFATIGEVEAKAAKKVLREEKEKEQRVAASLELDVRELWKPHLTSVDLFEGMGKSTSNLYTLPEIHSMLNTYITAKELVNIHDQAYINIDPLLASCISSSKGKSSKNKNKTISEPEPPREFMKRDEILKSVLDKMQNWYEVKSENNEIVTKKGKLSPIQVVTKIRQGRKASTLITGFEPFNIVSEDMAEDLRKLCASATSVSPIPGKPANSGMEVLVQGKQSKAVMEYLLGKGVPKKWIEVHDLVGKK